MHVTSKRVGLREFSPEDLAAVLSYRSDPRVKQFDTFGVNSEADVKAILAKAAAWANEAPRTRYFGAIYDIATGQLVGEYALYLNPEGTSGEIGIMLHQSQWGRGLAGEVLAMLQNFAVALGLQSLTARCHRDNTPSRKMLAKFSMIPQCETGESVTWTKDVELVQQGQEMAQFNLNDIVGLPLE